MARNHNISKEETLQAWELVRKAGGGAGYDNKTIQDITIDLDNQLYKIWNRMGSGSYMAQPVLLVDIPKAGGGKRTLGIPTVTDRVAQTVIKNRLEQILEPKFHADSYGYRPGKSAIDAVGKARERCFEKKWVIDLDIKGFFDNIDHNIMMKLLEKHTGDKTILLYAQRFLQAKAKRKDGAETQRTKGTPQGGVISPLLANLYLHEAFDTWMSENFSYSPFERYADDCIVHCSSEKHARELLEKIRTRLLEYKLELHPEKTKIIYAGIGRDPESNLSRKFTFLGYEFKPRGYVKGNQTCLTFSPAISAKALKKIRETIDEWKLHSKTTWQLKAIAKEYESVIRGWIQYYGHFRRSELYKMGSIIDSKLVRWLKRKSPKTYGSIRKATAGIQFAKQKVPKLFPHWHMIPIS